MPLDTTKASLDDLLAFMQARAASVSREGRNPVHDKEFKEARAAFRRLAEQEQNQ